jgi:hypothetical protein
MPVFGADVGVTTVAWDEPAQRVVGRNNEVYADAKYFVYHPMAPLDHPFSESDWGVVFGVVTRLRKRGYDSRAIRGAMNAFYLQRNADASHPAYAFASNDVLHRLMAVYEPRFTKPVRAFIANGFQRGNDELPWHPDEDPDIRRVILHSAGDLPYRYPEVVADLLVFYGESHGELNSQLRYINDIVRWNLDQHFVLDIKKHLRAVKVPLPRELSTNRRASHAVRKAAPTLKDAVILANERGPRELRDTNRLEERKVVAKPLGR